MSQPLLWPDTAASTSYIVDVRGDMRGVMYVWGSADWSVALPATDTLLLHLTNDRFGRDVQIATRTESGTTAHVGTLRVGEHATVPLAGLTAVTATSDLRTTLSCVLTR